MAAYREIYSYTRKKSTIRMTIPECHYLSSTKVNNSLRGLEIITYMGNTILKIHAYRHDIVSFQLFLVRNVTDQIKHFPYELKYKTSLWCRELCRK